MPAAWATGRHPNISHGAHCIFMISDEDKFITHWPYAWQIWAKESCAKQEFNTYQRRDVPEGSALIFADT